MTLAIIAGLLQRQRPKLFAACLLSSMWTLVTLLALQRWNESAAWWQFSSDGVMFAGMPLELYLGWVVLWGFLPQLAFRRLPLAWCAAIMIAVDLAAMPACNTVVHLGPRWLIGEAAGALLVLVPALGIARWTLDDTHLRVRAAMQMTISGLTFLFFLPELVFALRPGAGWEPLMHMAGWKRQLGLQAIALLAAPGVSAVFEFTDRGLGTAIPFDPPKLLVTSGIYRYLANPMQASCGLVMAAWSVMLGDGWLSLTAAASFVYGLGIAGWDEREDLALRFGAEWKHYRASVRNWLPRWRPYYTGDPAHLYIADTCGPCSEVRRWLEGRRPLGLTMIAAETLPARSIRRLRYDPRDGAPPVEGVQALARALEHLHLGWALAGAVLRLPVVWQFVQVLTDASGLGPREICAPVPLAHARGSERYTNSSASPGPDQSPATAPHSDAHAR
jgi:protein-S-isoprenylcysteine O-methyltransferase Ste14